MAEGDPKFVLDSRSLLEIYARRGNNALISTITDFLKLQRMHYGHLSIKEIGKASIAIKKYLDGIDSFKSGSVNAPTEIFATATVLDHQNKGQKISSNDIWSMAIAKSTHAILVVHGADRHSIFLRSFAKKNNIVCISFDDFVSSYVN